MTPCKTCVYYEFDEVFNSFECKRRLVPQNNIEWSVPCAYYIEDARHYKERTEVKKRAKVKKLKTRDNIREIE